MALRIAHIAIAFVALSATAHAGDGWRVIDTAGAVRFGGPGVMPVALTRDQELPADSWVETSVGGRVILLRGQETVIVEPNSRIQLPGGEVNGNTQVLQTLGTAIYKIGKQQKPHFQVDTPYLAAVVKGTEFTVNVGEDEASVDVTEGLVQVSTPDQTDIEFVRPGFTAQISRDHSNDVVVEPTPPKSEEEKQDQPGEKPTKSDDGTQSVSITQPIGDIEVDVKDVSGGLALAEVNPGDSGNGVKVDDGTTGRDDQQVEGDKDTSGKKDDTTGGLGHDVKDVPAYEADGGLEVIEIFGDEAESDAKHGNGNGPVLDLDGGGHGPRSGPGSGGGDVDIDDLLPRTH
jgi:hypothetical protein